jgi:lysophospholipase L1-like esterase
MAAQRTIAPLLRWWACLPALPIAVLQAKRVRKRVPRLPEAAGSRRGEARVGPHVGTVAMAIVGESTAVGVGVDSLDEALPGHLARSLASQLGRNVAWQVSGGNGMTVSRVLSTVSGEDHYDVAVVLLGVNDAFRLTPIKAWLSSLRRLADKLAEQGSELILFSAVPPIGRFPALPQPLRAILGARAALLDHHLKRLVSEVQGAARCDVKFATQAMYIARDGVHPSKDGYRDWAQQLALGIAAEMSGNDLLREGRVTASI